MDCAHVTVTVPDNVTAHITAPYKTVHHSLLLIFLLVLMFLLILILLLLPILLLKNQRVGRTVGMLQTLVRTGHYHLGLLDPPPATSKLTAS